MYAAYFMQPPRHPVTSAHIERRIMHFVPSDTPTRQFSTAGQYNSDTIPGPLVHQRAGQQNKEQNKKQKNKKQKRKLGVCTRKESSFFLFFLCFFFLFLSWILFGRLRLRRRLRLPILFLCFRCIWSNTVL